MGELELGRDADRYIKGDLEKSPVRRKETSRVFSQTSKKENGQQCHSTERGKERVHCI